MGSMAVAYSSLALRFFVLFSLAASIAIMATNRYKLSDGTKTTFKDVMTYRYVIATAMVVFVYTAIQIPAAIFRLCARKRNECAQDFDFYGDKVMSFLLATAAGAGFAVTYEFKKYIDFIFDILEALGAEDVEEARSKLKTYLKRGYIAVGLLFLGFICMAMLSVLSSIRRHKAASTTGDGKRKGYFYFF